MPVNEYLSKSKRTKNASGGTYILAVKMMITNTRRIQDSIVTELDTAMVTGRRGKVDKE